MDLDNDSWIARNKQRADLRHLCPASLRPFANADANIAAAQNVAESRNG